MAALVATGDGVSIAAIPVIASEATLLSRGVVFCPCFPTPASDGSATNLLPSLNLTDLTEVSMMDLAQEDSTYAFYKNIREDNLDDEGNVRSTAAFPVQALVDAITPSLLKHFVDTIDEVYIDDLFVVHYNTGQFDSRCAKHQDPSDVTVNVCLESSADLVGSQILFYDRKGLKGGKGEKGEEGEIFRVDCRLGECTLHWGAHPHETTPLEKGRRTNVVMTMAYKDKLKSGANRSCCA